MPRLAVIGNLSRDLVGDNPPRLGGGPFHAARALRLLARPAVLAVKCSEDDRRSFLRRLIALGLPVHWHASEHTATFAFDYEGDDRRMTVEAIGDPWTPTDAAGWLADALQRVAWVHVAPLHRTDFPAATLAELARERRVSLDGQGLARAATTGPLVLDADFDRDVLRHVSVLKLAEEEARVLVGDPDEESLRALGVPEVVVTLGRRGSIVLAGGKLEHVPARQVTGGRDPTGAGDAYASAYLASRALGQAPASAARRATDVVASLLSTYPR